MVSGDFFPFNQSIEPIENPVSSLTECAQIVASICWEKNTRPDSETKKHFCDDSYLKWYFHDISMIFPWYFHILKVFFSSYIYDRLASAFPKVDTGHALHWWISLAMQTSFFARKKMFLSYPITNPKYPVWSKIAHENSWIFKRFHVFGLWVV
jgi:hypothetical protein